MTTILVVRTGKPGTWREKLSGISAFAKSVDWHIQVVDKRIQTGDEPNSNDDFRQLLDFWNPSGIIIDASGDNVSVFDLPFGNIPVVYMTPSRTISATARKRGGSVTSDSVAIAKLAAKELLRRELGSLVFADGGISATWGTTKREAFARIAKLNGISPIILSESNESQLAKLPRPIGIFAVTDAVAAEIIVKASRIGLRVPEDISIVGVDDDPEICENTRPTLSSARPDFHRLGFTAAVLLKRLINHPELPSRHLEVPPLELVRRASSQIDDRYDPLVNRALEYIRLHACEGIGPKDVVEYLALGDSLSRRSLELRFNAATGGTITDNILNVRLNAACDYLRSSTASVSAIANFCGWESDMAFRKIFKSRFGVTPTKYHSKK